MSDETIINCIDESDFMKIILYAIEIVISTDDIEKVYKLIYSSLVFTQLLDNFLSVFICLLV